LRMNRSNQVGVTLAIPLAVALLLPVVSPAQEGAPEYIARLQEPGRSRIPIALPSPNTVGSVDAATFYSVVANDLTLSGWVEVIDRDAYIEPAGTGLKPGEFNFADWDVTGAVGLAKTNLSSDSGRLRSEVWVYDVGGERKLGAKAFTTGDTRALAHKVANEIIFQLTGQQGMFNTRFAAVTNWSGNKEITIVDFDGYNPRGVTKNGAINLQPSWDPSGTKLAFTSYVGGNPDLYVADLGQGRITRLSARSGINTGGTWSPRGGVIALSLSPDGDPEIFTIDASTGKQIARLTRSVGIDASPTFSPDGQQIAFVSERSGGAQIYRMNLDGTGVKRVTFQGSHNTDPSWSPDGEEIAYVSRVGVFDVFTVRLDGRGVNRLTQDAGDNEDPTWSPDGHYVAFSSTRTGAPHIWMSTADGYHQVQLTQGKGGYTNPSWSPPMNW
jgi:TolB protein